MENKKLNKIVNAAKKLFSRYGYEKTTVQKITEKAKIAKGTFYIYFNSKEELIEYMLNDMIKGISKKLDELLDGMNKKKTNVVLLIKNVVKEILYHFYNMKEAILSVMSANPEMNPKLDSIKQKYKETIINKIVVILDYAQKNKIIKKIDSKQAATMLYVFFLYYSIEEIFNKGKDFIKNDIDIIIEFIMQGLANMKEVDNA